MENIKEFFGDCFLTFFYGVWCIIKMIIGGILTLLYMSWWLFMIASVIAVFGAPIEIAELIASATGNNAWWFLSFFVLLSGPLAIALAGLYVLIQEHIHEPIVDFLSNFDPEEMF